MRVLLINPYYPISETPSPPLGLAYLAGSLERAGHTVRVLDYVVFPFDPEALKAVLRDFKPDLAGATAVTMTVNHALTVLSEIKAASRHVITILGGPHATFYAEEILATAPQVDAVVRGEGENTVVSLAAAIEAATPWNRVPGITFRDGTGCTATAPPLPANLEELAPPARHLFPLGRYRALGMPVSMTTSRGCPYKCIFCVGRKMVGAKVRYQRPERVVDEMEALSRMGFHQINLADDLFTANPDHCLAVCRQIMARGLKTAWTSFSRVDTVSFSVLEAMRLAGCTTISFGVESGCPDMLKRIKKGITIEQVERAMQLCLDIGIEPHASFILGLPGETQTSMGRTLAFGDRLKAMGVYHGFHILAPFPGTDVRERIDDYDLQILTDDWSAYHANRAIVRTSAVSPEAMNAVVMACERRFDEWLDDIGRLRDRGDADEKIVWPLTRLEHTVVLYDLMMKVPIETVGTWIDGPPTGSDRRLAEMLIDRASEQLDHPPERIRAAIEFAVDQRYLAVERQGRRVCWAWTDCPS